MYPDKHAQVKYFCFGFSWGGSHVAQVSLKLPSESDHDLPLCLPSAEVVGVGQVVLTVFDHTLNYFKYTSK